MKLCDAHCHLQDERLADGLDATLERARRAGVTRFVCCGSRESDWDATAALAGREDGVLAGFGLHPWYVRERSAGWLDTLRDALRRHPGAPVGELGLDHAVEDRDDDEQAQVFLAQLRLAAELQRPAVIHCRRAWGALQALLETAGPLPAGFMVHSYSGPSELVPWLVGAGGYLSFSGSITRSHNRRGRRAAAAVPSGRLLAETDAPDLPPLIPTAEGPRPAPGPNEPANLVYVIETLAALRAVPVCDMAALTRENAARLFGGTTPA
jgi:TatD DNase family protein